MRACAGRYAFFERRRLETSDQSGLTFRSRRGVPEFPAPGWRRNIDFALKRCFDIALSALALVLLLPLFALVALLIAATSRGPVFFRQKRIGHMGRAFNVVKFRTMYVEHCDANGAIQVVAGDDRVTHIGRFLRRTSIDELPQLLNVLCGQMSLIGPRPHVPSQIAGGVAYEKLVPYYTLRHAVPPGLSGWAQVNGLRGSTHDPIRAEARIRHDLAYIQQFSFWLDLRILVLTVMREFVAGNGT